MILIFDGDCGFCTSSARWIEARLPSEVQVAPWQTLDLDTVGLTEDDVSSAAWWVDDDGRCHRGHRAAARALQTVGGPWRILGHALALPPLSWFARAAYAVVARYRYRLPGATDACRIDT